MKICLFLGTLNSDFETSFSDHRKVIMATVHNLVNETKKLVAKSSSSSHGFTSVIESNVALLGEFKLPYRIFLWVLTLCLQDLFCSKICSTALNILIHFLQLNFPKR